MTPAVTPSIPAIPSPGLRGRWRERRALRGLPPAVRAFYAAALARARAEGDAFSLASASRPGNLAELLRLAGDRRHVVELGTCTAWTAIALALDAPQRTVTSFDPVVHPARERYLGLVEASVRERIVLRAQEGAAGAEGAAGVEFLFIDSSHERQDTVAEVLAWRPRLAPSAVVVFDDYGHPDYPGVAEAVADLGLRGEARGSLYVWRVPAG